MRLTLTLLRAAAAFPLPLTGCDSPTLPSMTKIWFLLSEFIFAQVERSDFSDESRANQRLKISRRARHEAEKELRIRKRTFRLFLHHSKRSKKENRDFPVFFCLLIKKRGGEILFTFYQCQISLGSFRFGLFTSLCFAFACSTIVEVGNVKFLARR